MTTPSRTHELKTWPEYFEDVLAGVKTFEVRRDDRGYQVGDVLLLREWEPPGRTLDPVTQTPLPGEYTGRAVHRWVTYVLRDGQAVGVSPGYVVMGLQEVEG